MAPPVPKAAKTRTADANVAPKYASDARELKHTATEDERKLALYQTIYSSEVSSGDGKVVWADVCKNLGVATQGSNGSFAKQ